jgi:hypothetical protein
MKQLKWKKEKTPKGLSYPTSREGHTITYVAELEQLILFGGIQNTRMNDIFIYDIN